MLRRRFIHFGKGCKFFHVTLAQHDEKITYSEVREHSSIMSSGFQHFFSIFFATDTIFVVVEISSSIYKKVFCKKQNTKKVENG